MLTFLTLSSFRPSLGAWRRRSRKQQREKKEALQTYKKMLREPYEEDLACFSGSKQGEGRSRRRKNWNARKRQVVEAETLIGAFVGEVKEVKRRNWDDHYLRLEMEERRRCRIAQLSSEKVSK